MYPVKYDEAFLNDDTNFETDTLRYHVEASAFLYKFLHDHDLNDNIYTLVLGEWINYVDIIGNQEISPDSFIALLDIFAEKFPEYNNYSNPNIVVALNHISAREYTNINVTKLEVFLTMIGQRKHIMWANNDLYKIGMGIIGFIFGSVGAFVFQNKSNINNQFKEELTLLLTNFDYLISNNHLFFLAFWFCRNGYGVSFVEQGKRHGEKAPDLCVERTGSKIYIEATSVHVHNSDLFKTIIYAINEKKKKFANIKYLPGLIAIDIGDFDLGQLPQAFIKKTCIYTDGFGGENAEIYKDTQFSKFQNNVYLDKIFNEFLKLDNKKIPYLLICQSNILNLNSKTIECPIKIILINYRNAKPLLNISKRIYWV